MTILSACVSPYTLGQGDGFPMQRRPQKRGLSEASDETIEAWFADSGITISVVADSEERFKRAKRAYTWKVCLARSMRYFKAADIIEHSIRTKQVV